MSYAIICDARKGHNQGVSVLALVNRSISRAAWWTSDGHAPMMVYEKRSAAGFCARRLRKNNARVVTADAARRLIAQQAKTLAEIERERMHEEALAASESGWDGHKHD